MSILAAGATGFVGSSIAVKLLARRETGVGVENPGTSKAPSRVFNIGKSNPVGLLEYVGAIEHALDREAGKNLLPLQSRYVPDTLGVADLMDYVGTVPPGACEKAGRSASTGTWASTRSDADAR